MSPYSKGMLPPRGIVASTADLTPNGVLGYAKGIAAFVAGLLTVLVPFLPLDSDVAHYVQIGVAVCGFIAVYAIPNQLAPFIADGSDAPTDPATPAGPATPGPVGQV